MIEKECRTIKELPLSERPYEKCERFGTRYLSDAELLAVIIKTGTRSKKAIDLANELLLFNDSGLLGINYMSFNDLIKIKGIGRVKAIQILCLVELSKRLSKQKHANGDFFTRPKDIAMYYMQDMRCLSYEQVMLVLLNNKNRFIKEIMLSKGTVNASLIRPREVFLCALKHEAVNIALVHNHPSGNSKPSSADIAVTKSIVDAGKLIGIELIDHIVIGDNEYTSLKESGLM